jgi:hypothetical protein
MHGNSKFKPERRGGARPGAGRPRKDAPPRPPKVRAPSAHRRGRRESVFPAPAPLEALEALEAPAAPDEALEAPALLPTTARPGNRPRGVTGPRITPHGTVNGNSHRHSVLGSRPLLVEAARVERPALELLQRFENAELPLTRILRRMSDPTLPDDYRDKLALFALPYCHPKIMPIAASKRIQDLSDIELTARIKDLERGLLPLSLPDLTEN